MTKGFALRNDVAYSLGEVISINPSSIGKDYPHQEIQYVDISSVSSGVLNGMAVHNIDDAPSRAKRLVKEGDTILSTVRPNRRSFLFIKNPPENIVVSTGFAVLRASDKIEPGFLYYTVTNQPFTDYLTANAKGAAYPAVDTETIARAEIRVPPLPTQRKIASILSAYDDLIENNLRRIKILEEMAHALYREWFVKFRFPGHEKCRMVDSPLGKIPVGWEIVTVSDVAEIHRGRSYRSKDLVAEGGLPFINLKCVDRDGGFRIEGLKRYNGPYKETQVAGEGDIVIAVTDMTQERRIVARAARIPDFGSPLITFSMDLVKILPREQLPRSYLYCMFRFSSFPDEVKQQANGVNVLHLSPDRISEFSFALSPDELQIQFARFADSIYCKCDILAKRNHILRRTRDLLHPKLISGELDVSDLDIKTGGHMQ